MIKRIFEQNIVKDQHWLLEPMKRFQLPCDSNGMCFGDSHVARKLALKNDFEWFNKRKTLICSMSAEELANEIRLAQKKLNDITLLIELDLDASQIKGEQETVFGILENEIDDRVKAKLSENDRLLLSIPEVYLTIYVMFQSFSALMHIKMVWVKKIKRNF